MRLRTVEALGELPQRLMALNVALNKCLTELEECRASLSHSSMPATSRTLRRVVDLVCLLRGVVWGAIMAENAMYTQVSDLLASEGGCHKRVVEGVGDLVNDAAHLMASMGVISAVINDRTGIYREFDRSLIKQIPRLLLTLTTSHGHLQACIPQPPGRRLVESAQMLLALSCVNRSFRRRARWRRGEGRASSPQSLDFFAQLYAVLTAADGALEFIEAAHDWRHDLIAFSSVNGYLRRIITAQWPQAEWRDSDPQNLDFVAILCAVLADASGAQVLIEAIQDERDFEAPVTICPRCSLL